MPSATAWIFSTDTAGTAHRHATGPESCTVSYNHFFVDPKAPGVTDVIALADTVLEQDRRIVESVQRNLAAGVYHHGLLSPRHENGVVQFQDLVRAATEGLPLP